MWPSLEGVDRGRQEATRQGREVEVGTDAHGDLLTLPLVGRHGRVSFGKLNSRWWQRRVVMDWRIDEAWKQINALSQATARRPSNALSLELHSVRRPQLDALR